MKKSDPNYDLDKRVKNLFKEVTDHFKNERTSHMFKMFGCDMAFTDARVNYKIIDEVIKTWKELGFD